MFTATFKKETAIPALIQQLNKIPTVHHSRLQPTFRLSEQLSPGRAHRSREVRRARQALGPPRDHPAVHIRRICRRGEAGGPRQALRRHDGRNDWSGGGGGCREVGRQGQEVTQLVGSGRWDAAPLEIWPISAFDRLIPQYIVCNVVLS